MKMDNVRIFEGNEVEVFELNEQIIFNPRDVGKCLEISTNEIMQEKIFSPQHLRKLIKVFGSIAEIVLEQQGNRK